jgi:hypothetical protein
MAGATVVALLAAHYLPHAGAGVAVFAAAALLVLAGACRQRRRTRAQEHATYPDTHAPAHAGEERKRGRARAWAWGVASVSAGLGALTWALGVWVLWVTGAAGLAAIIVRFYPRRSATPSPPSISPVSSPVDSGSWLGELPGRVADAVDAARLVRGHADAAGVQAPDVGEEA